MNKQDMLIYGITAIGIVILLLVVLPPFFQTQMTFAKIIADSHAKIKSINNLNARYAYVFISEEKGINETGEVELAVTAGTQSYNLNLKDFNLSSNSLFGVSPLEITSLFYDSSLAKAEYTGEVYLPRPCYLTRVWLNSTKYNTEVQDPELIGVISCFDLNKGIPLQFVIMVEKVNKATSIQFSIVNATFE